MSFVGFLYLIFGFFILISELKKTIKIRKIRISSCFKLMYSFVYGVLPAIVFFRADNGMVSFINSSNSQMYIENGLFVLGLSIIAILVFNIGYSIRVKNGKYTIISDNSLYWSGIIITIFGWISLIIWTQAAGGIFEFIQHADGIRAGYYHLNNKFAFMQNIAKIIMLGAFISFSNILNQNRKIVSTVFFVLSTIGSILFISAWDSRATLGFFFLTLYFLYLDYSVSKKNISMKRRIIELGVTVFFIFLLIVSAPVVFSYINTGVLVFSNKPNLSVIELIEKEFGFIIQSQNFSLAYANGDNFRPLIGNDLINSLVAWIPARFISIVKPETIWSINTKISVSSGTLPTDFISGVIYELWYFGIIIFPFLCGVLLKKLDKHFCSSVFCKESSLKETCSLNDYDPYRSIMTYSIAMIVVNSVSHFQIVSIVQSVFYLVIGYIIVCLVQKK